MRLPGGGNVWDRFSGWVTETEKSVLGRRGNMSEEQSEYGMLSYGKEAAWLSIFFVVWKYYQRARLKGDSLLNARMLEIYS